MNFKRLFLLMLVAIIGFSTMIACGPPPNGEGSDDISIEGLSNQADVSGNLLMLNESNSRLVLYKGEVPIRIVPNDRSDFVINVDTEGAQSVDLMLYKYDDVKDNVSNPSADDLFKRWIVPLSEDTSPTKRSTWTVFPGDEAGDSRSVDQGTVTFRYTGKTEAGNAVNVEVFLNNTQGARIATFGPGSEAPVALDLGIHTLVYRYWYSDQNKADGVAYLGVRERNTDGNKIYVDLARDSMTRTKIIASHDQETDGIGPEEVGTIKITNRKVHPSAEIWVGRDLIENVATTNKVTSRIDKDGTKTYELAAGEYTFIARCPLEATEEARITLTIKDGEEKTWIIE